MQRPPEPISADAAVPTALAALRGVERLTREMSEAAAMADWSGLATLEEARHRLLAELPIQAFAHAPAPLSRSAVGAVLRDALRATQEIARTVSQARQASHQALLDIDQGARAASKYLSVAGGR